MLIRLPKGHIIDLGGGAYRKYIPGDYNEPDEIAQEWIKQGIAIDPEDIEPTMEAPGEEISKAERDKRRAAAPVEPEEPVEAPGPVSVKKAARKATAKKKE